ncbi:MAG: hypothetical protein HZT43_00955 [Exiguobacterium profundum]|nr:MAG: hypothetical protein HZT43_00955 [Exiguobacterium profundum]
MADLTRVEAPRLERQLRQPGGAQFQDLPIGLVQDWRARCRTRRDVEAAVSDGAGAVHDLFGPIPWRWPPTCACWGWRAVPSAARGRPGWMALWRAGWNGGTGCGRWTGRSSGST